MEPKYKIGMTFVVAGIVLRITKMYIIVKNFGEQWVYVLNDGSKINEDSLANYDVREAPSTFADERAKTLENSTRYGKDILDNFDVETDLVVWPINNEFDQVVTFEHPEVIGRCPVSGYPDTYVAKFSFVTDELTMELKAFKLWLNSYYNKQVSHEYLGQEIFSVFWKKVKPKYLKVELFPAPRGNIKTVVTCEKYDLTKEINGVINV